MITDKRLFFTGAGLLVSFTLVFILIFSPVFNGQNGLEYLDDLYNSISKGSAYYVPKLKEDAAKVRGKAVSLNLTLENPVLAGQVEAMFVKSGAAVTRSESDLIVKGDLGAILDNCLADTDAMYRNQGQSVAEKYGIHEKRVLYNWWTAAKLMDKDLKRQKLFQEAKLVTTVKKKGLETSYNYYTIEPRKISDKWGIVMFSLIFYVIYTLWYGFAIMYLFEGWGLQLEH
ncbi:MAG: hypothetical protein MI863_23325 [Desulfobacterales bacterium]|nr:hypothetical protein [Desulfobacterales bacterium]